MTELPPAPQSSWERGYYEDVSATFGVEIHNAQELRAIQGTLWQDTAPNSHAQQPNSVHIPLPKENTA